MTCSLLLFRSFCFEESLFVWSGAKSSLLTSAWRLIDRWGSDFLLRLGDGLIPSGRARYLERLCGCFVYVVCVCKKSLEFQGCDLKEKFRVSRMCRLWLLLLFSCFAHPLSCPRHCNIVLFWPLVLELSVSALFVFLRLSNEVVDGQLGRIMFCALE